jgi:hypothetical protein
MTTLINRAFAGRGPQFENEHCFVRPLARINEGSVGRRRNEHIIEWRIFRSVLVDMRRVRHT